MSVHVVSTDLRVSVGSCLVQQVWFMRPDFLLLWGFRLFLQVRPDEPQKTSEHLCCSLEITQKALGDVHSPGNPGRVLSTTLGSNLGTARTGTHAPRERNTRLSRSPVAMWGTSDQPELHRHPHPVSKEEGGRGMA